MPTSKYLTNKFISEITSYGRGLASIKYPSEIEMYLMAMELVNSDGNTEQYFVFPITPNSIQKTEQNRTNIKKSNSGVTVLMSSSYSPAEISIKGDFGRSFKILSNPASERSYSYGIFSGKSKDKVDVETSEFDVNVKSGYGCIKILQGMIQASGKLDSKRKPYRLYFYNMALGESYMVAILPGGFSLMQTIDRNMIWAYNLTMQVVAPLDSLKSVNDANKSLKSLLGAKTIQNGVNTLVGSAISML